MDGPQNIAISKTGLLYCAATIGSFLHVPACTFVCTSADKYGCDPITANFREKTRPSSRSDQSYRACYLLVHRVEVQLTEPELADTAGGTRPGNLRVNPPAPAAPRRRSTVSAGSFPTRDEHASPNSDALLHRDSSLIRAPSAEALRTAGRGIWSSSEKASSTVVYSNG